MKVETLKVAHTVEPMKLLEAKRVLVNDLAHRLICFTKTAVDLKEDQFERDIRRICRQIVEITKV